MTSTTALPFIPYVRVSRIGGRKGEGFISPTVQIEECERRAKELGAALTDPLQDQDYSGGNVDRPSFQKALDLIRGGLARGIIVKDADRFSRDPVDGLTVLREIEAAGGELHTPDERITLSTPDGMLMAAVRFGMGGADLQRKKKDLATSVRKAIGRNVHLAVPYGYQRSGPEGMPQELRKGTTLEPHPVEAPIVKLAYTMRAAGNSWGVIAKHFNDKGFPRRSYTRDGVTRTTPWLGKSLRQLVGSETYLGVAHSGEHRNVEAHPALVTPKLWKAANKQQGAKFAGNGEPHLLQGILRCAGCGHTLNYTTSGGVAYYQCKQRNGCTRRANVNAQQIESWVEDWFLGQYGGIVETGEVADSDVAEAVEAVEHAKARLGKALAMKLDAADDAEAEVLDGMQEDARAGLRFAQERLHKAQTDARGVELPAGLDAAMWDELDVEGKRHLLKLVYACVVIRPAATYRQPAADRARVIGRDQAPTTNTALIVWVAALGW